MRGKWVTLRDFEKSKLNFGFETVNDETLGCPTFEK